MLEETFPFVAPDDGEQAPLRTLGWAELRARLGAAHELRGLLAAGEDPALTSERGRFDVDNTRRAVAQREGKLSVNHELSANGKAAPASSEAHDMPAADADRGRQ